MLNRKNLDQLLFDGYRNFKRTIALNYFTFPVQAGDPQIASLEARLDRADVEGCWNLARSLPDDPGSDLPDQLHYRYVVLLLWSYARQVDRRKYLDRLKEPLEGNPMLVPVEGQNASQDLANSLIEYYSIGEGVAFETLQTRAGNRRWLRPRRVRDPATPSRHSIYHGRYSSGALRRAALPFVRVERSEDFSGA